jgi:hypothetical protein
MRPRLLTSKGASSFTTWEATPFPALPKEVLAILNDGGLIPHVKKLLGKA